MNKPFSMLVSALVSVLFVTNTASANTTFQGNVSEIIVSVSSSSGPEILHCYYDRHNKLDKVLDSSPSYKTTDIYKGDDNWLEIYKYKGRPEQRRMTKYISPMYCPTHRSSNKYAKFGVYSKHIYGPVTKRAGKTFMAHSTGTVGPRKAPYSETETFDKDTGLILEFYSNDPVLGDGISISPGGSVHDYRGSSGFYIDKQFYYNLNGNGDVVRIRKTYREPDRNNGKPYLEEDDRYDAAGRIVYSWTVDPNNSHSVKYGSISKHKYKIGKHGMAIVDRKYIENGKNDFLRSVHKTKYNLRHNPLIKEDFNSPPFKKSGFIERYKYIYRK